ncbi:MAG: hypothetical protein AAFR61_02635 [Bacteroidota bacterium]
MLRLFSNRLAFGWAFTSLLFLIACGAEPVDPDPTDPPAFEFSGNLTVDGQAMDLAEWMQGAFSYASAGNGMSLAFAKTDVGSFTLFLTNVSESELVANHTFDGTTAGGQLGITLNGSPVVGTISDGSLQITKVEAWDKPTGLTERKLVSGNFTFSGTATNGQAYSASGTFANGLAIFQ